MLYFRLKMTILPKMYRQTDITGIIYAIVYDLEWQMKSEGYEGKTEMVNQAHFNS